MWHFGVDSIDEYTGKEFHVTLKNVCQIYSESILKEWKITNKRSEQNTKNILTKMLHMPLYKNCFPRAPN